MRDYNLILWEIMSGQSFPVPFRGRMSAGGEISIGRNRRNEGLLW